MGDDTSKGVVPEVHDRVAGRRTYAAYLLVALAVSAVLHAWYLVTHPFPALAGGLYLDMSSAIMNNGWGLPARIPEHTVDGIPFAYPPLAFYLIAGLRALGIDGAQVLRFGGPLALLGVVWGIYHLTLTLFDRHAVAAVAGIVTGTHVTMNTYLIAGSGFVRSIGFLLQIVAMIGAYRWFARDGGRRALALTAVGWGLVLLTHPVQAASTGLSVFGAWLVWDRSLRGAAGGAAVAAAGVVLASPWWATVVLRHGPGVLFTGAGSHGSLNSTPIEFVEFGVRVWQSGAVVDWPKAFALLGGAALVARRDWRHPVWLLFPSVFIVTPHRRLLLFAVAPLGALGAVMAADYVYERSTLGDTLASLRSRVPLDALPGRPSNRQLIVLAFLAVLIVPFVGMNLLEARGTAPGQRLALYADDEDREAMAWLAAETPSDARVVAIGGASEWLPYLSDRTSVIEKYGTEWVGQAAWDRHQSAQTELADCWNATCVRTVLSEHGFAGSADYLYVPRGLFVSGRGWAEITPALHESLAASDRYTAVYRNEGVVIYEVTGGATARVADAPVWRGGSRARPVA